MNKRRYPETTAATLPLKCRSRIKLLGQLMLMVVPALAPLGLSAQSLSPAAVRLSVGETVRILSLRQPIILVGELVGGLPNTDGVSICESTDECNLRIQRGNETTVVPLSDVDSVWVKGHAAKKGAIIGAAVLGLAVAIHSLNSCQDQGRRSPVDDFSCDSGQAQTAIWLLGGAVGASGGAVVGGLVGWLVPVWDLRFVR